MSQPSTFLMDPVAPNEQAVQEHQPIIWTAGRIYDFLNQIPVSTNKYLAYKSLDGGITWTTPNSASANVVHGFADWDGPLAGGHLVTIAMFRNSGGVQSPVLQTFDLNAETYSANFGPGAGLPSVTLAGLIKVAVMANGRIMLFFPVVSIPAHSRVKFAIYDPGSATWPVTTTDLATNVVGNDSQWETVVPDPVNNLCHVFYSDTGNNFFYRQINSAGTLGAITALPAGWNLFLGNLNFGKAFNTGFLDTVGNNIVVPVFTRDPVTHIYSLAVVTGTPINAPLFSISPAIDTAANFNPGQDIGQAIGINNTVNGTYQVTYFMGDGANNYNLVKLATFSGGVWTHTTLYDATLDPNAGENIHNQQWINAISGTVDLQGNPVFQIATWLTLAGQAFQNTATITTLVGVGPAPGGKPQSIAITGLGVYGGGPGQGGGIFYVLPDPKVCKEPRQMRRQFQNDFYLPNMPSYPGQKKPAFTRNGR